MRTFLKAFLRVLLVSLCVAPAFAIDPVEMSDPALQERYRNLSHELRCMQCQNQSIADSPVGLAGDLRREVRQLLEEGKLIKKYASTCVIAMEISFCSGRSSRRATLGFGSRRFYCS